MKYIPKYYKKVTNKTNQQGVSREDHCHERTLERQVGRRVNEIKGVHATTPEGAFYLFVDFNEYSDSLHALRIHTCAQLCDHLIQVEHTALLPGDSLMLPADDFSVRLSFVDYDGDCVLQAWRDRPPATGQEKEYFFETHCPLLAQGIQNIERYFQQVREGTLPIHV